MHENGHLRDMLCVAALDVKRHSHRCDCVCRVAEFATLGDMKNAITKLHNTDMGGRRIRVIEDTSSSSSRRQRRYVSVHHRLHVLC